MFAENFEIVCCHNKVMWYQCNRFGLS